MLHGTVIDARAFIPRVQGNEVMQITKELRDKNLRWVLFMSAFHKAKNILYDQRGTSRKFNDTVMSILNSSSQRCPFWHHTMVLISLRNGHRRRRIARERAGSRWLGQPACMHLHSPASFLPVIPPGGGHMLGWFNAISRFSPNLREKVGVFARTTNTALVIPKGSLRGSV